MNSEIRKPDYDLEAAFEYNPQDGIALADIKNILAEVPGEADGPAWHWIVELQNGKFAYLTGSCDYTGWDCQSSLDSKITDTVKETAELAEDDNYYAVKKSIKQQLLDQLKGKQPFGLREQ